MHWISMRAAVKNNNTDVSMQGTLVQHVSVLGFLFSMLKGTAGAYINMTVLQTRVSFGQIKFKT